MSNGWVLPDEVLRDAPAYTPRPRELADLELLLTGAYAPLTGFLTRADLASVSRRGRLADGTPWPVPVTLRGAGRARRSGLDPRRPAAAGRSCSPTPRARRSAALDVDRRLAGPRRAWSGVGGPVRRLGDGGHGPFQRLRRTPEEVTRAAAAGPGARRDRRPAAAPPAARPDRPRRPHARRAPAGA